MIRSSIMRRSLRLGTFTLVLTGILFMGISFWVYFQGNRNILRRTPSEPLDYVIVLGASVHGEKLSDALKGRMNKAIELYSTGHAKRILISGDGTDAFYNETLAMSKYLSKLQVPSDFIDIDPKGYSTFDSLKRAREDFTISSAYIVSQPFHLARAVWLANVLGIKATGVETATLTEELFYSTREVPARVKDFFFYHFNMQPSQIRQEQLFKK